jgi:hypothetical protein
VSSLLELERSDGKGRQGEGLLLLLQLLVCREDDALLCGRESQEERQSDVSDAMEVGLLVTMEIA